jgi:hypothetical protein
LVAILYSCVLGWEREKAEKFWEKGRDACGGFYGANEINFFLFLFFVLPEVRKKNPLSPCV